MTAFIKPTTCSHRSDEPTFHCTCVDDTNRLLPERVDRDARDGPLTELQIRRCRSSGFHRSCPEDEEEALACQSQQQADAEPDCNGWRENDESDSGCVVLSWRLPGC